MSATESSIVLTAVLSTLLTWVFAYVVFRGFVQKPLERQIAKLQDEFEERVRQGVIAAGADLMPALREQVKQGLLDGLNQSRAAGLVEDTARVVSTGAGLVESGINALLGLGKQTKR